MSERIDQEIEREITPEVREQLNESAYALALRVSSMTDTEWADLPIFLRTHLEAAYRLGQPHGVCTWTLDVWDESSMHETSCGEAFTLADCGELATHGFKFCVYCGKAVEEVRIDRYADEDEVAPPSEKGPSRG